MWVESDLSRAKITKHEIEDKDTTFYSVLLETANANQLFLSETEDKLGTLAVAMPQQKKFVGSPVSSVLLGDRNMMIARLFAEILAKKTEKISLVSVFVKSLNEQEAAPILRKLMDDTLKKVQETDAD
jgi:hypothetical protein